MDHVKHKQLVKIIAIVDIVLSALAFVASIPGVLILIFALHAFILAKIATYEEFDPYYKYEDPNSNTVILILVSIVTIVAILVLVLFILEVMKLVAAMKLLKASESGTEQRRAYDNCHFWKIVNMAYLIVNAFSSVIGLVYGNKLYIIVIFNLTMFTLHTFFLCIVYLYSQELKALQEPTESFQSVSATCEMNVLPRNLEFTPRDPPSYYAADKHPL